MNQKGEAGCDVGGESEVSCRDKRGWPKIGNINVESLVLS